MPDFRVVVWSASSNFEYTKYIRPRDKLVCAAIRCYEVRCCRNRFGVWSLCMPFARDLLCASGSSSSFLSARRNRHPDHEISAIDRAKMRPVVQSQSQQTIYPRWSRWILGGRGEELYPGPRWTGGRPTRAAHIFAQDKYHLDRRVLARCRWWKAWWRRAVVEIESFPHLNTLQQVRPCPQQHISSVRHQSLHDIVFAIQSPLQAKVDDL